MLYILLYHLIIAPNIIEGSIYWYDGAFHDDSSTSHCNSTNPADTSSCCSSSNKCGTDQGDCDIDADCLDGLKCGKSAAFMSDPATDMCYPKDYSLPGKVHCDVIKSNIN